MNGFSYRGRHSSDFPGLTLLSYLVHPPDTREFTDTVDGLAGEVNYGTEFGSRPIELVLLLEQTPDKSIRTLARELVMWFRPTLPAGWLVFDDDPGLRYTAKYAGQVGIEPLALAGQFTLTMKCYDPYAYGDENILQTTITTSPAAIDIQSDGTEPTPPVIELTNTGSTTINGFILTNEYQLE